MFDLKCYLYATIKVTMGGDLIEKIIKFSCKLYVNYRHGRL